LKFFRLLLTILVWTIVVAVILAALAFVPNVQTWVAQAALDQQAGVKASVGSVSLGIGELEVEDLRIEADGAVLTLPSLQADFPVLAAGWNRRLSIRKLVAKGWKLDLSHFRPAPEGPSADSASGGESGAGAPATTPAAVTANATRIFRDLIHRWELPCDGSLDGVELNGEVDCLAPDQKPGRLTLTLKGGGLSAGHDGAFTLDASAEVVDSQQAINGLTIDGHLIASMATPRLISRVAVKADVVLSGEALPSNLLLAADFAVARGAHGRTYSLDLSRGGHHLASILAQSLPASGRFAGTWAVDLRDSDAALFVPDHPLPSVVGAGQGRFETDSAFRQMRASGRLHAVAGHLDTLAAALGRLGTLTLDTDFDLTREGTTVRVDRLSVAVAGDRPAASFRMLQPFDWDRQGGSVKLSDPNADWLAASIQALPLAWLPDLPGGLVFSGGDVAGECLIRSAGDGFAIRAKTPLTAAGVSVQRSGRVLGSGLDLSLALAADGNRDSWRAQGTPLIFAARGRRFASLDFKASGAPATDPAVAVSGKWTADLDAIAAHPENIGVRRLPGRSASGAFTATFGPAPKGEGTLSVVGHTPGSALTATFNAEADASGMITLKIPLQLALGATTADLTAEGTWAQEAEGPHFDVELTGKHASLGQLRVLAGPLLAVSGGTWPAAGATGPDHPAGPRDLFPFWGHWTGRLTVGFERFTLQGRDFNEVGGSLDFDRGSLRLIGARGNLTNHSVASLAGTIAFDPAAPRPYRLKATASLTQVEASAWFGPPHRGDDPILEGHFAIDGTLTSDGANPGDLASRLEEEVHVKSPSAILRLLKTNIGEAIPEVATPVSDTLGKVGSVVGSFLGRKAEPGDVKENPISPSAQAVLDFIDQVSEFGCDEVSATIVREPDHSLRILDLAAVAPEEHLTGSGEITFAPGKPVAAQPLSLDLRFGARGQPAKLLQKAGLLSAAQDKLGYSLLNQPVHFGGTLAQIDGREWHDLLAKAATQKPAAGTKPAK
jgi:hypothetical protein